MGTPSLMPARSVTAFGLSWQPFEMYPCPVFQVRTLTLGRPARGHSEKQNQDSKPMCATSMWPALGQEEGGEEV